MSADTSDRIAETCHYANVLRSGKIIRSKEKTLEINKLEHDLINENSDISEFSNIGKVDQLFRIMR
ncbi:hypothetical protein MHY1_00595 [Methylovirgula sp. HY1]|nr:hypothetical protein MHY1_00595 [Methylovirgula sp. HY1]